jgi:ATP-dependent Clp protease protease subunit
LAVCLPRIAVESRNPHPPVICQGPPPPNPLVVERFQGVVSQLFQQVGCKAELVAA